EDGIRDDLVTGVQTCALPISPEQLKGERGAASSDIYAVGIILYEMLCGKTPFDGENVFAVMNQHVSQDPPSILDFNPKLPPELRSEERRVGKECIDRWP